MVEVSEPHLAAVKRILQSHVPEYEIWAFGSRTHGKNLKPHSDLDLAVVTSQPLAPSHFGILQDAFADSDLPFKVDIVDWSGISEEFRSVIRRHYEVIQTGKPREWGAGR